MGCGRTINFRNIDGVTYLAHQMDAAFSSIKEIETPLGMDGTGMMWRWADVGSCQMPRVPPMYPTKMIGTGGAQQPATSQVDYTALYRWILSNLAWLSQYDTAYVFVDNRELPSQNHPDYWPYFAPWIKSRCEVIGPYNKEKTTAIYVPICPDTGLHQVHFTWAGAFVLEALCLVHPTVNFALTDSDCVPTTLFEVAELVSLMTDQTSRSEAMQHHTMACTSSCPPAVLLMTESKAELNAGLIIVTGHTPARPDDTDMAQEPTVPEHTQGADMSSTATSDVTMSEASHSRAHKSRRIDNPRDNRSPDDGLPNSATAERASLPLPQCRKTQLKPSAEACSLPH